MTRRCATCGRPVRYRPREGRPPAYCSDACERAAHAERERGRRAELRRCGLCCTCKQPVPVIP